MHLRSEKQAAAADDDDEELEVVETGIAEKGFKKSKEQKEEFKLSSLTGIVII